MFDGQVLSKIGMDPITLHPKVLPRPDTTTFERADRSRIASDHTSGAVTIVDESIILTEEEEDLADILSPINDELSLSKTWWFLELLPMKQKHQKEDGSWVWRTRFVGPNACRNRFRVPHPLFSGPTLAMAGTSLVVIITKSEYTERSKFGWKLRKRYFLGGGDTSPELSHGKITAWSGLIEEIRMNGVS